MQENHFDTSQIMDMMGKFEHIVEEHLSERISGEFMRWLNKETDFFVAPASTKYHGAYPGGLLEHSLNVYRRMMEIMNSEEWEGQIWEPSAVLVALFHDLCKINTYWESFDGKYTRKTDLPMGHGEKSVYLLMKHGVQLTDEEALAIRWHMGAYDDAVKGDCRDMNDALRKSPLVLALQQADMQATYWDEE